jgi:4-hydroxy-4-methyl-2-oxoglutarate aldolase
MYRINRRVSPIASEVIEGFREIAVPTIGDAQGRFGCMSYAIKPLSPEMRLVGNAVTVQTYRADNLLLHVALQMACDGDILVVDAGGIHDTGLWGGLMTRMAMHRKLGGLVIDGGVRDSRELVKLGFPVFARAISPQGGFKVSPGSVNIPIACGGTAVHPGDLIAADADGVVVVPSADAPATLAASRAILAKEEDFVARMGRGESLFDLLGLGESLGKLGLKIPE